MVRHPSENFIKYLMTGLNAQATNDDWIATQIVSLGFPHPDRDYLLFLRSTLNVKKPAGFQPDNKYNRISVRFMRDEGIYALHNQDRHAKEARNILMNLRARPIIENLLLGRMEPKDIAKKVNARLGEFFTAEGIDAYRHYFWDVSKLSVEDWSKLLQDYDVQRQNTLAILQVGPSMALHKMGFNQSIDSKTVLKDMMEMVYFDAREWKSKAHGIDRTRAITALSKAAVMIDTGLSAADNALKDSLKAFEQFRMKHAKGEVKSVREVAPDGNFSGSGVKLLEAKSEESDNG
jgi:hypothetical protein